MHYVALINGRERKVEITEVAPSRYRLIIDGHTIEADAQAVSDDTLSLIIGNQAYNIESEKDPGGAGENLLVRGHLVNAEIVDLRRLRIRQAQSQAASHDGPRPVEAPMPGKVVAVLVRDGDEVAENQGLLVIEAMKMENEVKAPKAGIVRQLKVEPGQTVDGGVTLCVIE